MQELSITITPKQHTKDVYFIFRENGDQVIVDVSKNEILSNLTLTKDEINYVNAFIINK